LGYGVSLALYVVALRHLGAARTGAYFSTAPFLGAVVSIFALGESLTLGLVIAGGLMAIGVWLHVTEYHVGLRKRAENSDSLCHISLAILGVFT
jgi:drug/metabolite transporter (DMT)-like permease